MSDGILMVLSGPSGVGKGTITQEYSLTYGDMVPSISSTTRQARKGEIDGKHYFFISEEEFLQRMEAGAFIEYAKVHGNYYGTSQDVVRSLMAQGKNVLLEIDPQGAMQVKESLPEAVLVFVYPPSWDELERRLRLRATETPEQIEIRLKNAYAELRRIDKYDYAIENRDLDKAVMQLHTILTAEQLRAARLHKTWD